MFPADFEESNCVLDKPPGLSRDNCEVLSVCRTVVGPGYPVVISCWKPTKEELEEIVRTGRVWLSVWGETMPPVAVLGITPFV